MDFFDVGEISRLQRATDADAADVGGAEGAVVADLLEVKLSRRYCPTLDNAAGLDELTAPRTAGTFS